MGYIGADPELMAITTCTELLEALTIEQRLRVMAMLGSRFGSQQESSGMRIQPVVPTEKSNNLRLSSGTNEIESPKNYAVDTASEEYPTFYSVYSNEVTQSESEVLLVMAFYASNYGASNFTREVLLQYSKDQEIHTESRRANFSNNISVLVRSKYLEAVAKGNYRITKSGKQKALEIINREECPKTTSKKSLTVSKKTNGANNKGRKDSGSASFLPDLNLHPDNKDCLDDFYGKYAPKNNYENTLIFVYYLVEILKFDKVGVNEIYTCYKTLGLEIPNVLYNVKDIVRRKTWLTFSQGEVKLHWNGENYVKKKMQKKEN